MPLKSAIAHINEDKSYIVNISCSPSFYQSILPELTQNPHTKSKIMRYDGLPVIIVDGQQRDFILVVDGLTCLKKRVRELCEKGKASKSTKTFIAQANGINISTLENYMLRFRQGIKI